MVSWPLKRRYGPIGVDIGARSVKLVQFSADHSRLLDAARWDVPATPDEAGSERCQKKIVDALKQVRDGRGFRGRDAVLCLNHQDLFLQNVRVPKVEGPEMQRLVQQEAASRLPFPVTDAELRFIEAADVRQGDATMREVILLACRRDALQKNLDVVERAGLCPVAVEVEPEALLRCYVKQFRRDEDRQQRSLFVHVGYSNTAAVIAEGEDVLFVKYIDGGGRCMDEAVARHLEMDLKEAAALRRHNGDRRIDQQDPEIARGVAEAVRPVIDRLATELSMCIRYHSVTFRGRPLARLVLGGGEATPQFVEAVGQRLDLKCELGDPLRSYQSNVQNDRKGQWDVAAGLALRDMN